MLHASSRSLSLRFGSDITFVDFAVDVLGGILGYQGVADPTGVLIVCRELLKNAVVHGNRNDRGKPVLLNLEHLQDGSCRVVSEDGGEGFDGSAVARQPDDRSGRGYALIRTLASRVTFNDKGNRVTVLMDP